MRYVKWVLYFYSRPEFVNSINISTNTTHDVYKLVFDSDFLLTLPWHLNLNCIHIIHRILRYCVFLSILCPVLRVGGWVTNTSHTKNNHVPFNAYIPILYNPHYLSYLMILYPSNLYHLHHHRHHHHRHGQYRVQENYYLPFTDSRRIAYSFCTTAGIGIRVSGRCLSC